jgi:hypothetical protein
MAQYEGFRGTDELGVAQRDPARALPGPGPGGAVGVGALAAAAAFAAILATGLGWTAVALMLGVGAVVVGIVRMFGSARLEPGTGYALTGVLVGAASLVLVLLLWWVGAVPSPLPQETYSGMSDGGVTYSPPAESPSFVTSTPDSVTASSTAPDSTDDGGNTVTFAPEQLVDGDTTTAWRVAGSGVGEYVTFSWNSPQHLRQVSLIGGYAKQDLASGTDRFAENRRLEQVTLLFDGGSQPMVLDPENRDFQSTDVDVYTSPVTVRIDGSTTADADYAAMSEAQFTVEG